MDDFGTLTGNAVSLCKARIWEILFGILLFSAVISSANNYLIQKTDYVVRRDILSAGIPEERFNELNKRMEEGDSEAFEELQTEMMKVSDALENMREEEKYEFFAKQSKQIAIGLFPFVLFTGIIIIFIQIFSAAFFLIIASSNNNILQALKSALGNIIPFAALAILIFIRSLIWIPLIVLALAAAVLPFPMLILDSLAMLSAIAIAFCFFFLLPKYVFSGLYFLKGGPTVSVSIKESTRLASGNIKEVNTYYAIIFLWTVFIAGFISSITPDSGFIHLFLKSIAWKTGLAFASAFTVVLFAELNAGGNKS